MCPPSAGDNNTVGLFDWLNRKRGDASATEPQTTWTVLREGDEIAVEDGRGGTWRVAIGRARNVRIVPMMGSNPHPGAPAGSWQVTLAQADGDALVGKAQVDWRVAEALARLVCERTQLPLDEMTERMFSRVGTFSSQSAPTRESPE